MRATIIGGGSVGLLFASFLAEQGAEVTIITRRDQQAEVLNRSGLLRLNMDGTTTTVSVRATTDYSILPQQQVIIVAVKYIQLQEVFKQLTKFQQVPPLLFVQNGLAHYEQVCGLPYETILFSSVAFGAEKQHDTCVVHRGIGSVTLAIVRGNQTIVQQLLAYTNKQFPLQLIENAESMLLQKAFFNCLINPLTYVLQVKNGELLSNPQAYMLLKSVYNEMISVFSKEIAISFEEVEMLCQKTSANTSSMFGDRLAGRKTEIDTIVGAMLQKAERKGKDLPILRTLYYLVVHFEGVNKEI